MRVRSSVWKLIIAIVLVTGVMVACGGPEAPQEEIEEQPAEPAPEGNGAALLEERCATCHGLDRTTSALKTREEWEQTVTRMVAKGAELNAEEQDVLIAYLAETYGP